MLDLHFRRPDHPAAVPTLQATQAVQPVVLFFTQTPFSWWWSFPLFVDGEALHAAVYLHKAEEPFVQRKHIYLTWPSSDQGAQSFLPMEDIPWQYDRGNALGLNNAVQV